MSPAQICNGAAGVACIALIVLIAEFSPGEPELGDVQALPPNLDDVCLTVLGLCLICALPWLIRRTLKG